MIYCHDGRGIDNEINVAVAILPGRRERLRASKTRKSKASR